MKNKVQLITYIDRLGKSGVSDLHNFLKSNLSDVFEGGMHLLPFYYPIDGADAGYDPIDHSTTDQRIGTWSDINLLSQDFDVMADLIVNHISAESKEFEDVKLNGKKSAYYDLFLTKPKVFPNGNAEGDIKKIYRPRPNLPFTEIEIGDGEVESFWTTFTSNQLDIDVRHELGVAYLDKILNTFEENGIKSIRLDAAGYAIKKPGTSCFMIPETFDFIDEFSKKAKAKGIKTLVEIHAYYKQQIEIAKKVDYVYDFALPPLVLHAIATGTATKLKKWLDISPRNCVTVLDTHDGIGIMDVARQGDLPGLLEDDQVDFLVESIHEKSNDQSRLASGEGGSNLDIYQVNCTFYEALGKDDQDYLMARAIQFFSPGIPQVYYGGFLAAENDMALMTETNVHRDINRPYFSFEEIENALDKEVVKRLIKLIKFRNNHPSFEGEFSIMTPNDDELVIKWADGNTWSQLQVSLKNKQMSISFDNNGKEDFLLFD